MSDLNTAEIVAEQDSLYVSAIFNLLTLTHGLLDQQMGFFVV